MDYTSETKYEIWNNTNGEYLEIGPDRDALGLIEIRSYNDSGKIDGRLTFTKEQAALVSDALKKAISE